MVNKAAQAPIQNGISQSRQKEKHERRLLSNSMVCRKVFGIGIDNRELSQLVWLQAITKSDTRGAKKVDAAVNTGPSDFNPNGELIVKVYNDGCISGSDSEDSNALSYIWDFKSLDSETSPSWSDVFKHEATEYSCTDNSVQEIQNPEISPENELASEQNKGSFKEFNHLWSGESEGSVVSVEPRPIADKICKPNQAVVAELPRAKSSPSRSEEEIIDLGDGASQNTIKGFGSQADQNKVIFGVPYSCYFSDISNDESEPDMAKSHQEDSVPGESSGNMQFESIGVQPLDLSLRCSSASIKSLSPRPQFPSKSSAEQTYDEIASHADIDNSKSDSDGNQEQPGKSEEDDVAYKMRVTLSNESLNRSLPSLSDSSENEKQFMNQKQSTTQNQSTNRSQSNEAKSQNKRSARRKEKKIRSPKILKLKTKRPVKPPSIQSSEDEKIPPAEPCSSFRRTTEEQPDSSSTADFITTSLTGTLKSNTFDQITAKTQSTLLEKRKPTVDKIRRLGPAALKKISRTNWKRPEWKTTYPALQMWAQSANIYSKIGSGGVGSPSSEHGNTTDIFQDSMNRNNNAVDEIKFKSPNHEQPRISDKAKPKQGTDERNALKVKDSRLLQHNSSHPSCTSASSQGDIKLSKYMKQKINCGPSSGLNAVRGRTGINPKFLKHCVRAHSALTYLWYRLPSMKTSSLDNRNRCLTSPRRTSEPVKNNKRSNPTCSTLRRKFVKSEKSPIQAKKVKPDSVLPKQDDSQIRNDPPIDQYQKLCNTSSSSVHRLHSELENENASDLYKKEEKRLQQKYPPTEISQSFNRLCKEQAKKCIHKIFESETKREFVKRRTTTVETNPSTRLTEIKVQNEGAEISTAGANSSKASNSADDMPSFPSTSAGIDSSTDYRLPSLSGPNEIESNLYQGPISSKKWNTVKSNKDTPSNFNNNSNTPAPTTFQPFSHQQEIVWKDVNKISAKRRISTSGTAAIKKTNPATAGDCESSSEDENELVRKLLNNEAQPVRKQTVSTVKTSELSRSIPDPVCGVADGKAYCFQGILDDSSVNCNLENRGVLKYDSHVISYVVIDGYKYITLLSALKLFPHCVSKCAIPHKTMKKYLHPIPLTYDQVRLLDRVLIGRQVCRATSGDIVIRAGMLLDRLSELREEIKQEHKNTALIRSRRCTYFTTADTGTPDHTLNTAKQQ